MNLEGLTKTARRNTEDEKSQMCVSHWQDMLEWRGATTRHGDASPNWHEVMVVVATAVVENLRVKAGRASTLGRHYRSKPDERHLRANLKPSQREPV
jgi:hypothetical protein